MSSSGSEAHGAVEPMHGSEEFEEGVDFRGNSPKYSIVERSMFGAYMQLGGC